MKKIIHWYEPRNEGTDMMLDHLLNFCIDSGIEDYHINKDRVCEGCCKFKNGIEYSFWNRNMPYAWLNRGAFDKDGTIIYLYDGTMPRKRTMNRLYNAICEYIENNMIKNI